jgi:hypothetical protein
MKQIATVIPGIITRLPADERLAGFKWQTNRLGEEKLIDAKGNPYPLRVVTCYTDSFAGRMLMFHLTVLNSPLGHYSNERDCKPALVGIMSLEEGADHIVRLEQLIDALQNCYIHDDDNIRDEEATHMMHVFSNMKSAPQGDAMGELATKLGLKVSDPFTIGWTGSVVPRPDVWLHARRWNLAKPDHLPKMDGPSHPAFADLYKELHKLCLELGTSHSLIWLEREKDWTITVTGTDDVPLATFGYGDLGLAFFEAFNFLYGYVEKKYAA